MTAATAPGAARGRARGGASRQKISDTLSWMVPLRL